MTTAEIIFGLIIAAVLLVFGYTQYQVSKRYKEVKARMEAKCEQMGLLSTRPHKFDSTPAFQRRPFRTTSDNKTAVNSDMVTSAVILGAHLEDIKPIGNYNVVHRDDDNKARFISGAWETPSSYDSGSSSSSSDSSSSGSSYD